VLGEAESFEDIALYGRCKREWLEGFLALPNGIPSHDTFRRVLMLVDPDTFERSFLDWVRAVFRPEEGGPRQVAVDGKTVRRSFDRRHGRSPLHLVSAYATEGGIVLAQRATETKGGELAVLPELLDGLDLAGCLVSLDALACQPAIAERVVARGGDYLLALKGNRRKAHAEVRDGGFYREVRIPNLPKGLHLGGAFWPGPTVTSTSMSVAPCSASSRPAGRSARSPSGSAATPRPSTASWAGTASATATAASAATSRSPPRTWRGGAGSDAASWPPTRACARTSPSARRPAGRRGRSPDG
jgi:hypothetical protein